MESQDLLKELKESQTRYRIFTELTSNYVYSCARSENSPYRIDWMGGAFENITGYAIDEVLAEGCWIFIVHPDDKNRVSQYLISLHAGENGACEFRIVRKDRGIRWLQDNSKCVRDEEDPAILKLYGACRDVTNRVLYIDELRYNEERLDALLKMSRLIDATEEDLLSFVLESLVKLTQSEGGYLHFFDEESRTIRLSTWSQAILKVCKTAAGMQYHLDEAGVWADAVRKQSCVIHNDTVDVSGRSGFPEEYPQIIRHMSMPVFENDRIVAIAGVANKSEPYDSIDVRRSYHFMNDAWKILKQNEAEHHLKLSEERHRKLSNEYNTLLDSIPDAILLLTPGLKIEWLNRNACAILGIEPIVSGDRCCYELLHGRSSPCDPCPALLSIYTGLMESEKIVMTGGRILDVRMIPIKEGAQVVNILGIMRDVTEHRMLEEQLFQAQKMEAIGTLAGGVAHDFNNIMTAVIGYGNLLLIKMKRDDPLRRFAEQILAASERAASLTKSLLAYSRKQTMQPRPVDLNQAIQDIVKLLTRVVSENIVLDVPVIDETLIITIDPVQLEQIIFNLATNARDAMPEGGTLTIQTSRMHMDDKFIRRHGFGRSGEFVMLTARDTGSGIDPHIIQRIFEPFFTTKEVGKGTGLGLSMVYGIVKQNDGFIDVQSDPGKGTTFSIYFPISALQPSEKRFHTKTRASGGHETILLVEDDNTVREMVRNVLESSGYRILIAKNGEEAMMVFKENRKEIQLLISDVVMPKKGGQEVLTEIRGINPAIKVILLSGYPKEELGRLSNYDAFLPKPLIPDNLLQTLREVLDR